MDFKTRFQGRTSHITKDGGIADAVLSSVAPINKAERITVNNAEAKN